MNRENITIDKLLKVAKDKKYKVYDSNQFHLNIWGIRTNSNDTSKYDDYMVVFRKCARPKNDFVNTTNHFRKYEKGWSLDIFTITTHPGKLLLLNPENVKGTAIVKEGQYIDLWTVGLHKGKYKALVQCNPVIVYRDNDKDDKLDVDVKTETGLFGINCHRASQIKVTDDIGLYSAGCQVHKDIFIYLNVFLWLIDKATEQKYDKFTYTLINENDLV